MTVVKGSDLMIFKRTGQSPAFKYESLANATNCSISMSAGVLETSSKDSGKWTDKQPGKLSWNGSSDNLYVSEDFMKLYDAFVAREPLFIAFDLAQNADSDSGKPSDGWQIGNSGLEGFAIITALTANAPDGDNATYNVTFDGCGELKSRKQA